MQQQDIKFKLWFNAYLNIQDMMNYRGLTLSEEYRDLDWDAKWNDIQNALPESDDLYIVYESLTENKITLVGFFPFKVDIKEAQSVINKNSSFAENFPSGGYIVNTICVMTHIAQGQALTTLTKKQVPFIERKNLNIGQNYNYIELFSLDELQYNPLKHRLQPKIEFITDEVAKELLRVNLTKALQGDDKSKTLMELLPLDPIINIVPRWYGALVGDVFKFTRKIGGTNPYYRIVSAPDAKTQKEKIFVPSGIITNIK